MLQRELIYVYKIRNFIKYIITLQHLYGIKSYYKTKRQMKAVPASTIFFLLRCVFKLLGRQFYRFNNDCQCNNYVVQSYNFVFPNLQLKDKL